MSETAHTPRDDGRCEGGWKITGEVCPYCGATEKDLCGVAEGLVTEPVSGSLLDALRAIQTLAVASAISSDTARLSHVLTQIDKAARTAIRKAEGRAP